MVWLIGVRGVYKPPKLQNFGPRFCPQGPRMAAPHGTSGIAARRDLTSSLRVAIPGPMWSRHSRSLGKIWDQKFPVYLVYKHLWPKSSIPHPITIKNMWFGRMNFFWCTVPLREGGKIKSGKKVVFCQPPLGPPPPPPGLVFFGQFSGEIFFLHFFDGKSIYNAWNRF